MLRRFGLRRWMLAFLVLSSGTLFQTSCSSIVADGAAGLATSVADQYIRNVFYQLFNISSISSLAT